jgi:hypothetical protein
MGVAQNTAASFHWPLSNDKKKASQRNRFRGHIIFTPERTRLSRFRAIRCKPCFVTGRTANGRGIKSRAYPATETLWGHASEDRLEPSLWEGDGWRPGTCEPQPAWLCAARLIPKPVRRGIGLGRSVSIYMDKAPAYLPYSGIFRICTLVAEIAQLVKKTRDRQ